MLGYFGTETSALEFLGAPARGSDPLLHASGPLLERSINWHLMGGRLTTVYLDRYTWGSTVLYSVYYVILFRNSEGLKISDTTLFGTIRASIETPGVKYFYDVSYTFRNNSWHWSRYLLEIAIWWTGWNTSLFGSYNFILSTYLYIVQHCTSVR